MLSHEAFSQQAHEVTSKGCAECVSHVNGLLLEKTTLCPNATVDPKAGFPCYKNSSDISYIYKDGEGRVRKFIIMVNHPETSGYTVHYFHRNGNLVYSYLYNRSYLSPHFYGYRYMYGGSQLFCDMDTYNEELDVWERITYEDGNILSTNSNSFDKIVSADSVMPFCKLYYKEISDIFSAGRIDKVRFRLPEKGDKTIINATRVNIRESDNLKSNAVLTPLFGEIVKIIEKGSEEYIKPYGKNHWYKVAVGENVGYIFGAFLEPVEQIITDKK